MTTSPRDTAQTLVRSFLATAPTLFAYVVDAPGYRGRTRVQQASSHGFEDVAPAAVTTWFWATWRFDTDRLSGEVRFGDREYALSLVAAPAGTSLEYELWEWAQVHEAGPKLASSEGQFCDTVIRLQSELRRFSTVFHALADRISLGRQSDLTLLAQARASRQATWHASLRGEQQARARAQADEAFRAGNYSRVIELLGPFELTLTPAERAKVAVARRKSQGEPG